MFFGLGAKILSRTGNKWTVIPQPSLDPLVYMVHVHVNGVCIITGRTHRLQEEPF